MTTLTTRLRILVAHLWRNDAPLTATGLLMIAVLAGCAAGLLLDPRTITGAQAWRGTTSHFNVGTLFDGVLFIIMGLAIVVQTRSSIAVAVALRGG